MKCNLPLQYPPSVSLRHVSFQPDTTASMMAITGYPGNRLGVVAHDPVMRLRAFVRAVEHDAAQTVLVKAVLPGDPWYALSPRPLT